MDPVNSDQCPLHSLNGIKRVCEVRWELTESQAGKILKQLGCNLLPSSCPDKLGHVQRQSINHKSIVCRKDAEKRCLMERLGYELSDEIILFVLQFVPIKTLVSTCSLVSKKWQRLCCDSSLWKNIDLKMKKLRGYKLAEILARGVVAVSLLKSDIMGRIIFKCPTKLAYLDLTLACITVENINAILNANHTSISLKMLCLEGQKVNQKTLDLLNERHKALEVLNMTMCTCVDQDMGFKHTLQDTLIELNVSWMINYVVTQIIPLLPSSGLLTKLNVSGFRDQITDEHVSQLVIKCPNLSVLDMCDSLYLTQQSLQCLLNNLPHLKSLNLSRCFKINSYSKQDNQLSSLEIIGLQNDNTDKEMHDDVNSLTVTQIKRYQVFSSVGRPNGPDGSGLSLWDIKLK